MSLETKQNNSNTQTSISKRTVYTKKRIALSRIKRKILKNVWLARFGFLLGLITLLYLFIFIVLRLMGGINIKNYLPLISDFIITPEKKINTFRGRTNILILGKSGKGHDAPDLTDTIIFTSVSSDEPSVVLTSLPRDIWIPSIRAKLNSAYYWGKQKQEGGGIILAKALVEEMVDKPIHYALVFDFSSFTRIIDVLEGVEVNVERGFIDEKYPIAGKEDDECNGDREYKCRYETIEFEQGLKVMDGETALKFVRSRNAEGEEGTDLAREARQQKVVVAVKEKVFSFSTLLSPKKIFNVWQVLKETVETDINESVGAILIRKVLEARKNIKSFVLPEEYLENPPISSRYDQQYVFIPQNGTWDEVQNWLEAILD